METLSRRRGARTAPAARRGARAPAPPRAHEAARRAPATHRLVLGALALAGALAILYADAWRVPFLNDDYLFLDKTRRLPFLAWWGSRDLFFQWWRPWSREFHYGAMQAVFGPVEAPFHAANLLLIGATLATYFVLARRWAGARSAAIATTGLAMMAAWALPALWIAGVQDLWMLFSATLALLAWDSGRTALATLAFAVSLASKETACVLPALFVAHDRLMTNRSIGETARRVAVPAVLVAVWADLHPHLGGRWLRHTPIAIDPRQVARPTLEVAWRTVASLASLDTPLRPESGWSHIALFALPVALLAAAALVLLGGGRAAQRAPAAHAGVVSFGIAWAALGWLPLLLPTLGWHSYYGLFGAMGAWIVLGRGLARRAFALAPAMAAVLAVCSFAHSNTRSRDWGDGAYQRRAGTFVNGMRGELLRQWPRIPPHTRLFFTGVPNNVGFLSGDGPSVRVWYRDSTLQASYFSAYRPRDPRSVAGEDWFFRFDSLGGWQRIRPALQDSIPRVDSQLWRRWHEGLGSMFADGEDWPHAYAEFAALARVFPQDVSLAWDALIAAEGARDSSAARRWLIEAERRPGGDPTLREGLKQARGELFGNASARSPSGR